MSDDNVVHLKDVMRQSYRELTDDEKEIVKCVKRAGEVFYEILDKIENAYGEESREIECSRDRIEEAVMWAVKHITRGT